MDDNSRSLPGRGQDGQVSTEQPFLETGSNIECRGRETSGWFAATRADLLFYFFANCGHLTIVPMPDVREWFDVYREGLKRVAVSWTTCRQMERVLKEIPTAKRYQILTERKKQR